MRIGSSKNSFKHNNMQSKFS